MRKSALVTIGMPVYNCRATVAEAIASILNQTFADWELVVLDDGSSDGTPDVVKRFPDQRIFLVEGGTNRGLPACLNQIVRRTKSTYFARMDGDDIAYPDRLRSQVKYLRDHPAVDLVAGAMAIFGSDGEAIGVRRGPEEHHRICARPASGFPMAHPTWMGRTEWFRRNPYPEDAERMEDWAVLFRAHGESRFANMQEVVLGYREASLSLAKLTRARWHQFRFVLKHARTGWEYVSAIEELGRQSAKVAIDAFALGTGLNHRVLRHRIPPITRAEADEWREVRQAARIAGSRYAEERESVPA
jgi:glycosyltransferase involved in cell wall biosynthesis